MLFSESGILHGIMKLACQEDIEAANETFNYFHGGIIKAIRVVSGNDFFPIATEESGTTAVSVKNRPSELGFCRLNTVSVELEIHVGGSPHPQSQRVAIIRAVEAKVTERLLSFVGCEIGDLIFDKTYPEISCLLTVRSESGAAVCKLEDNQTVLLFSANEMEVMDLL